MTRPQFNAAFGRGLLARMIKDETKARSAFARFVQSRRRSCRRSRIMAPPVCMLALIDAGLGRKEEALREIRRAVELMPMEKDSIYGADMIHYSAIVAAWVGEKDLALQNLGKAAQLPGFVSLRPTETATLVRSAPRRSALRKNRRLACAEIMI